MIAYQLLVTDYILSLMLVTLAKSGRTKSIDKEKNMVSFKIHLTFPIVCPLGYSVK